MNIIKIKVGYEHPMAHEQSLDLDLDFSYEVLMNLDNVLYVTPFDRYIKGRTWTFYSIQLIGEHHLFSLFNPFEEHLV